MKLLTLNTHSWQEEDQLEKLAILAKAIIEQSIDVIALQEVNQNQESLPLHLDIISNKTILASNFGYLLQQKLAEYGADYDFTWDFVHTSYDIYQEGLSFLTRNPIQEKTVFDLSENYNEAFWKHRRAVKIGLTINQQNIYFINCHCGWWNDEDSPFQTQIDKIKAECSDELTFLMGDFNNSSCEANKGYDYVLDQGFIDTIAIAEKKDSGETVIKKIDGWEQNEKKLRIDYIFVNQPINILSHQTIFNGKEYPIISDHFGVLVELSPF